MLVNEHDRAISMYKKAKQVSPHSSREKLVTLYVDNDVIMMSLQYDPMVRLVGQYHSDLLTETHLLLAKVYTCTCMCTCTGVPV